MTPLSHYQRLFAEAAQRAIPLQVALDLTHECTYRCRHCYVPDLGATRRLPTARVLGLLEELAEMGTLGLALTGGEALLHPDWRAIARRSRELGFMLYLLTNGAAVTDEVAGELRELDAVVDVSLYSLDPAVFESVTGRPGSLGRTLAGIERLRERHVTVVLKVPLLPGGLAGLDAVFAYAESIGAECQAFPTLTVRQDGDRSPLASRLSGEELAAFVASPHCRVVPPERCRPLDDGPLCAAGTRHAAITPAGDVLACLELPASAGNILERSFREVWETSPWLARLRAMRRGDLAACGSCDKLAWCGRCPAQALAEDGELCGPSRWACERAAAAEAAARQKAR